MYKHRSRRHFLFYRYVAFGDMRFVAVALDYLPKIKHALNLFGSFKAIPSDWEVRGIFLRAEETQTIDLDAYGQHSEIMLNCLEEYEESQQVS